MIVWGAHAAGVHILAARQNSSKIKDQRSEVLAFALPSLKLRCGKQVTIDENFVVEQQNALCAISSIMARKIR